MKKFFSLFAFFAVFFAGIGNPQSFAAQPEKSVVAYVTSWSDIMPDPQYMTHLNYAFGHVNESFDGVGIANPERLKKIAGLKKQAPDLKIMLSIGGWGSGRFSEMAADAKKRAKFAKDCARVLKQYNLDGIDIDWEYPTSNAAGISASPQDTENFTLLMRDIRKAIGQDKLLTLASVASGDYINFIDILPYIDFVNIMAYDIANAPKHHSPLYKSENTTDMTMDASVRAHINKGVPPSMLVAGMPFYGRGKEPMNNFGDYGKIQVPDTLIRVWDYEAKVPYVMDHKGNFIFGYNDAKALEYKCDYAQNNGLRGAMYWDYAGDDDKNTLRAAVADNTIGRKGLKRVLVLNEGQGQHAPFTKVAMQWLRDYGKQKGFAVNEINHATPVTDRFLEDYDLIIQLDFPPYTWPEYAQKAFIDYIEGGKGAYMGFHHATLLGDFDGYPLWDWFSDFMGGITFNNYVAPTADGTVVVEQTSHPIFKGLPEKFVIPNDEWYTYDKSPRPNVNVLANVDESTYSPMTKVKMGDHPVIWINPAKKARNIYFQIGHSPKLLDTPEFVTLWGNALDWALDLE